MTAFLFARDLFKEEVLKNEVDVTLMFDEHNPTVEDEILNERLSEVFIRPKQPLLS